MPARGRVWQGVPSAGGRGAGLAARGIGGRGDVERLRRDAGAGSCLRGQSQMNSCFARAREKQEEPSSGPLVKRYAKRIP